MAGGIDRRAFLGTSALSATAAGLSLGSGLALGAKAPSQKVTIGVMGMSRGRALALGFARQPGVVVKYLCDIDTQRTAQAVKDVEKITEKPPQGIGDFRRILDDPEVDAFVCAAPNHWHAPSTILACAAGKNVYVEKPCCHNPHEGELMVAAARKYNKAVQMGSQRRSGSGTIEAMQKLHEGVIGKVYLSRAWYNSRRPTIGNRKPANIPSHIDYELWQGPAPRVPYHEYVGNKNGKPFHYNWHWLWHWGNGELGNNGIHTLDLCRWGVDVDYPTRVTSSGGRYVYDDAQQTPDTHTVCFEFDGGKQITWEGLSCNTNSSGFVKFYGETGTLALDSNGSYIVYDDHDKVVQEQKSNSRGDSEHMANFLAAIRNDKPLELNAEIEIGHKSTLLCHLGNIAQRTGRTLNCNSQNGHILGDNKSMALWQRDYEKGWEPKV
jgi:predicted dehydrogenase